MKYYLRFNVTRYNGWIYMFAHFTELKVINILPISFKIINLKLRDLETRTPYLLRRNVGTLCAKG